MVAMGKKTRQEIGSIGGAASAAKLTPEQRRERASKGGQARWSKVRERPCSVCSKPLGPGRLTMNGTSLVHASCVRQP